MEGWLMFASGIITIVGIYALLTMSLNLQFGKGGLINLGLVAFFGIGGYAYTLLTVKAPGPADRYVIGLGMPVVVGIIGAIVAGGLFAYLIGLPTLRLSGEYLAIATYAFAEVLRQIFANEVWLTNGVVGFNRMVSPFRENFEGNSYQWFLMVTVVIAVIVVFFLVRKLSRMPFGRVLKAIRENEEVALAVGKDVASFKMRAFVLSGAIAGLAGAIYTWYTTLIVPSLFTSEVTWTAWIALVLGGTGNYVGAIAGTAILIGAQEATRFFQASAQMATTLAAIRFVAMGLLIILIIRFRPKGILPEEKEAM